MTDTDRIGRISRNFETGLKVGNPVARQAAEASLVQFVHFPLTDPQIAAFKRPEAWIVSGIDHPNYRHPAILPEHLRAELAGDLD